MPWTNTQLIQIVYSRMLGDDLHAVNETWKYSRRF